MTVEVKPRIRRRRIEAKYEHKIPAKKDERNFFNVVFLAAAM